MANLASVTKKEKIWWR